MIYRDAIRYAWRGIKRRQQLSAGAMLSYSLVSAIIVAVSFLPGGTRDAARNILWDIGAHSVAYIPRLTLEGCCIQTYSTERYDPAREGFVANNAPSNLIFDEQIEMIRRSPNVADASPYLMFRIRASTGQGEWVLGGVDLTRPVAYSATVVAESQVVEGEFIIPGDMERVMVELEFAGRYSLEAGSMLRLGDRYYEIAAIVNPPLRPGKANIYMSLPALRELVVTRLDEYREDPANAVLVESLGARYHEAAKADIAAVLGQTSRISSFGCSVPGITAMGITENAAWIISVIVIICMLLMAVKIQTSSVILRQVEIGILMAVGWTRGSILRQLMAESFLYALIGASAGILLSGSLILLFVPAEFMPAGGIFGRPVVWAAALLIPVCGATVAGMAACLKAFGMRTAEILRTI